MLRATTIARHTVVRSIRLNSFKELEVIRYRHVAVRRFTQSSYTHSDNPWKTGIYQSTLPHVNIPDDMSVPQYVLQNFDKFGNREAMIDATTGRSYTFPQLKELVYRCASGLTMEGFKQGDTFAVYLPNVAEYFFIFNAVQLVGGAVTTVNPLYTADELVNQLRIAEPRDIITLPILADKLKEVAKRIPSIKNIYVTGEAEGCKSFSSLLENDGSRFPQNVTIQPKTDVGVIPYSSGTTGIPKGVMLSPFNFIAALQQLSIPGIIKLSEEDTVLAFLPFFHIYGMAFMNHALMQGARLLLIQGFEPENFLRTIQDHKATYLPIVPPVALFLAKHPMVEKYDLSSVNTILYGAAPISPDIPEIVVSRTNPNVLMKPIYGMSETAATYIGYGNDHKVWPKGSCGVLVSNMVAKIVDIETGEILPIGETGNLLTRGPQTMLGYFKNKQATDEAIDSEGWLSSGDICYIDEYGHLHVEDRLKELIKYKGLQVAPAELEAVLISHPEIQDAGVIGIQDEEAGEIPKAFVVTKSKKLSTEEIYKFVEGKVAPFKKLRGGVEIVDEIPKSQSGKILRKLLKDVGTQKRK
ncbi:uncharacterized protein LOC144433294 [Glandiceps talaboti]